MPVRRSLLTAAVFDDRRITGRNPNIVSISSRTKGASSFGVIQSVDMPDVGMVQRRENFGFTFKPGESIGISRERFRQHLERHVAIKFGVPCSIHLAHAAFADLVGDAEGPRVVPGLAPVSWTGTDLGFKHSAAAVSSRS